MLNARTKKPLLVMTLVVSSLFILTGCTNSTPNNYTGNNTSNNSNVNDSDLAAQNAAKNDKYDSAPPTLSADELKGKKARVKTTKGDYVIELYGDVAPQTVSNFIFLAKEDFYDNNMIHRYEPGFVVQMGDPLGDDPRARGSGGPGYTVPNEISNLKHVDGIVATARTGDQVNPTKASSGSQFYIVIGRADFLDNEYTIFGKVIEGMDVVKTLRVGDRINDVTIE